MRNTHSAQDIADQRTVSLQNLEYERLKRQREYAELAKQRDLAKTAGEYASLKARLPMLQQQLIADRTRLSELQRLLNDERRKTPSDPKVVERYRAMVAVQTQIFTDTQTAFSELNAKLDKLSR